MKKCLLVLYCGFCVLYSAFSQTPAPVACYNFSGDLNEANGGTALIPVNGSGAFVKGLSQCIIWSDPLPTDTFYNWAVDQGLDLPIGNVFPKDNYTIELLFKFTSVPYQRSWQRIIDFKNNTSDLGLYTFQSGTTYNLQMYTQNTGTTNMTPPNTWIHLFLTRDALTGVINGYVNDSLQITLVDAASAGVFVSDLILFKDDIVVQNEESAGTIDYLRIFDQPLTQAQIRYIVNTAQPVISVAGNRNLCKGDSTVLSASGASYYLWSNGATTSSITVNDTASTFYSVTAWNYLFCTKSCKAVDTLTVNVTSCGSLPHAVFTSSDTAFCDESGKCIDFFDHSMGNPTSWKWTFPGADPDTSTLQNPTSICYNTPGTYAVKLVVTNSAGTDSLNVSPLIVFGSGAIAPTLKISGDTIFCSHESSYQWYYNGAAIPGAIDSFYVATDPGTYNVYITDNIGCSRLGDGILFMMLNENNDEKGLRVYPNPAGEELWVVSYGLFASSNPSFGGWVGRTTVEIKNVLGENVYLAQPTTQNPQPKTRIDVSSLAQGMYIVELTNGNKVFRAKFVKE